MLSGDRIQIVLDLPNSKDDDTVFIEASAIQNHGDEYGLTSIAYANIKYHQAVGGRPAPVTLCRVHGVEFVDSQSILVRAQAVYRCVTSLEPAEVPDGKWVPRSWDSGAYEPEPGGPDCPQDVARDEA